MIPSKMGRPPKKADEYPEQGIIAELLRLGGYTQAELAELLAVDRATISRYLSQKSKMGRAVQKLAENLLKKLQKN